MSELNCMVIVVAALKHTFNSLLYDIVFVVCFCCRYTDTVTVMLTCWQR